MEIGEVRIKDTHPHITHDISIMAVALAFRDGIINAMPFHT